MNYAGRLLLSGIVILILFTGCGKEDHTNIFHMTFTLDGTAKDYTTDAGFWNFACFFSNYCITYGLNNSSSSANSITLGLPKTPAINSPYNRGDAKVDFKYLDASGNLYKFDSTLNFTITVTQWEGIGGYGKGTFSGQLIKDGGTDKVTFTNGTFEGFIHN